MSSTPKGFFPDQDTGLVIGNTKAPPDISYRAMLPRQESVVAVLRADPAVAQRRLDRSAVGNGNASVSYGPAVWSA